jgi:hypothetical protein
VLGQVGMAHAEQADEDDPATMAGLCRAVGGLLVDGEGDVLLGIGFAKPAHRVLRQATGRGGRVAADDLVEIVRYQGADAAFEHAMAGVRGMPAPQRPLRRQPERVIGHGLVGYRGRAIVSCHCAIYAAVARADPEGTGPGC